MFTDTGELFGLTILRLAAPAASSILIPGTVRLRPAWEGVTKLTPAGVYPSSAVDCMETATPPDWAVTWKATRSWSESEPSSRTRFVCPAGTTTVLSAPSSALPIPACAATETVTGLAPGLARMS